MISAMLRKVTREHTNRLTLGAIYATVIPMIAAAVFGHDLFSSIAGVWVTILINAVGLDARRADPGPARLNAGTSRAWLVTGYGAALAAAAMIALALLTDGYVNGGWVAVTAFCFLNALRIRVLKRRPATGQ
jgi:hypothetical protein